MIDFIEFMKQNWQDILILLTVLITCLINFKKTGRIDKEIFDFMKSKIYGITLEPSKAQTFEHTKPEYALDKNTGELIQVGTIDIDALIQSSVDCALDRILDKFGCLPENMKAPASTPSDSVNIIDTRDEFAELDGFFDDVSALRDRYGLDQSMSIQDVFKTLDDRKNNLSKQIADYQSKLDSAQNIKKEDKPNA